MIKPIKFLEYQPRQRTDLYKEGLRENDIVKLERFNKRQKKQILRINSDRIKATSYVGIICTGHSTIQILPKLSRENNEMKIVKNLLFMLSYTKKLDIREADISHLCEKKRNQILEILIYLFAKNLIEILKTHFFRDYKSHEDDLTYIKGRIDFNENLKRNLIRQDRTHCHYSEFTENVLINQIFRYTVFILSHFTSNEENYVLLKQLTFMLSDIDIKHITVDDFYKIHLNRLNRKFEPLLQLSKLFINQSSIELFSGKLEIFSFIFDMEKLFEEFVAELIKKHRNQLIPQEARIKTQGERIKLVDRPNPLFLLKPDILITNQNIKIILDTKYKELNPDDTKEGVSQSDMYQMLAYAVKHRSKDCVLIYPSHIDDQIISTTHTITYDGKEIRVHIKKIPLDIDMIHEKMALINNFNFLSEIMYE